MAGGGAVTLVGGGPGDPGLMTVRGLEAIRQAEVLIYDRLVGSTLLAEAPADCEMIDVGKQPGAHRLEQAAINALLIDRARAGRRVTRLKGGDPFVFGRGGEEAAALAGAGLPFEIVAGVSSAIAAPAYAGIPLTYRGIASSFQVIAGHEDPQKPTTAIDWQQIAAGTQTLVILMGIERLAAIALQLMTHGRPATTPVALVRWGTCPNQQTLVGTLADIAERAEAAGLTAPAVIVVGEVVRLRHQLRWFDRRPLFGRQVLLARSRVQASRLVGDLTALGATVYELPTLQAAAPEEEASLGRALARLADYDWVLFCCQTAVERAFARLAADGGDARAFGRARVAAVGPGTAAALAARGIRADLNLAGAAAERLVSPLVELGLAGQRLLVLRSEAPRAALVAGLVDAGASVDQVVVYRLVPVVDPTVVAQVRSGQIDAVVLGGSGTVHNLAAALDGDWQGLAGASVVAIGPTVARVARSLGLSVDLIADQPSLGRLIELVCQRLTTADRAMGRAADSPTARSADDWVGGVPGLAERQTALMAGRP